jgi:4-hydroxythreonine-4-phosphate dehydrogenase
MAMPQPSLPIALTMGDPAGIGPEIILKAFANHAEQMHGCCVVGNLTVMRQQLAWLANALPQGVECVEVSDVHQALQMHAGQVPVCPVTPDAPIAMGEVSAAAGQMAADAVRFAARAALQGRALAVVTAPLHKKALSLAGVEYPGHTEMLQALAAEHVGVAVADLPVRMMLSRPGLRVVLVSIHVSLRQAIEAVTTANVLQTLQVIDRNGLQLFGHRPVVWVAGLNPHAGEDGLFGQEEMLEISPAVSAAKAMGIQVSGPFPPDTVFMQASQSEATHAPDVVLAMYHDQGLIPVKLGGLAEGVNQTLGLPFVRTSPDHGTAFDIAGKGLADPASLLAAVAAARASFHHPSTNKANT